MTPEFQLIHQIRELVQSDMVERNPVLEDFAEQFAEICHEANQRLQRCAEYLAKGMRSEAVHEANSSPGLLELAKAINFPELKKWRNVCHDLELATFAAMPEDILEILRTECSREKDLDPLLREYRRAVYQADRDECIRLLRELREHDADNPSWPQNLQPLEESQLPALIDQAHEALADGDLFALKVVNADLTHPQRAVAVSPTLLAEIKDALLGERRGETMRQGQTLAARIDKALGAGDAESVDALMAAWEKLEADEAFQPTPDMQALAGRARDWQELRHQETAAAGEFQSHVDGMWALLEDTKAQEAQIRHQWDDLLAEGREVPERLARSVDEAVARRQATRRHRRRLLGFVVLLLVLAGLGTVAGLAWTKDQRDRQTAVLGKLEAMLNRGEYNELESYLGSLRGKQPAIYALPEVKQYVDAAAKEIKRRDELDRTFEELFAKLTRIRREGFVAPENEARDLLANAHRVAETAKPKQALSKWERDWDLHRKRQQASIDDALVRITSDVRGILDSRKKRPFSNLSSEAIALQGVPPLLVEATPLLARASTNHVETFNQLVAQHDAWKRDYERRAEATSQASDRLIALRRTIPAALPDLARYFSLLEEFVKEFPDEPEAASYAHVIRRKPAWEQAVLLERFQLAHFPPDGEATVILRKWLGGPLRGSPWEGDVRDCLEYSVGTQRARASLGLLPGETRDLRLKVFRIRRKGDVDWRLIYYPDTIASRTEEDEAGERYNVYWGKIFWYENRDQEPYLTHTKNVFPNNISSLEYDVRIHHQKQANMVPHAKFLYAFITRGLATSQLDIHLLKGIKELLANEEIEAVPKAWVLKRLVSFTAKAFPDTPGVDDMLALARKLTTEVPWGNPTHLEVIRANQENQEQLQKFPDVNTTITKLLAQRELTALALSRRLHCVGSIQRNEQGQAVPSFARPATGEVWTLGVSTTAARPYFRLAGYVQKDGTIKVEKGVEGDLVPGQLLLAPGDEQDTRELRGKYRAPAGLRAPNAWPHNAWQ